MQLRTFFKICLLIISAECIDIIVPRLPPKPYQAALMARYIVHNTDWVSIATISVQDTIKGYPFVSLKSSSDGPKANSTGNIYLYMTEMDVSGQDIEKNNRVTVMATLAELDYCQCENFDPQDPRCAKVLITGSLIKLQNNSAEYEFGKAALFERHPPMKNWPKDHQFYVAKVDMKQIDVLDYFGGIKHVKIEDYFNGNITNVINEEVHFTKVSVIEIIPN